MSLRCLCQSSICRSVRRLWHWFNRVCRGQRPTTAISGARPTPSRAPAVAVSSQLLPRLAVVELSPDFVYELLIAKTPAALDRLFPVFLEPYLQVSVLQSADLVWTARVRAVRALRAGVSARRVWLGEFPKQAASLALPFDNQFYVVLRTRGRSAPFFTSSYAVYTGLVFEGENFVSGSISHGFPTLAEVEIFCRGAQIQWPQEIPALL